MNELALFAGAGGGILGGMLNGWRTVCGVEIDSYARGVLLARQRDGILPRFPVWDDVTTFDGTRWRGYVDVVSGGFPCQDISVAGGGRGIRGERSGLWSEFARIIGEVQPRYVFVENSPMLVRRGLGVVLGDLSALGYDAEWGVIGAGDIGAPHQRKRIWIVAYPCGEGLEGMQCDECDTGTYCERDEGAYGTAPELFDGAYWKERAAESAFLGRGNGVAHRVDRLKCIGNGQVPAVAAHAFRILSGTRGKSRWNH